MAVSNPPSMSSVIHEFGGPGNLRSYYRSGPYVPDTSVNAAISTDPNSLKLSQFAGAQAYINVSVSLSASTISKNGTGSSPMGPSGSTSPVTATASGGNGGYTYSWTRTSGDTGAVISSTTAATVTWSRANCQGGTVYTSVWKCTASDGTSSASASITVNLSYTSTA